MGEGRSPITDGVKLPVINALSRLPFAVLALVLVCIGLYGLLSYEVSRRMRKMGIRSALGVERLVANGLGTMGRSRNGIEVLARGTGRIVLPAE